jgi:DNA polymerase-3 subunit delta
MAATPPVLHAFEFLEAAVSTPLPRAIALVGDDRFLTRLVIQHLLGKSSDSEYARYNGEDHTWVEVIDELSMTSLFATGPRRLLLENADTFVSRNRPQLESFVQDPTTVQGSLILDLQSLPSNTRLYRYVAEHGWLIECRLPEVSAGRGKKPDESRVRKWLAHWAHRQHAIRPTQAAIERMGELIGWELGLLDQELAKLALFVAPQDSVDVDLVDQVVGGWRTQTTWEMLEAAADGNAADAIRQLDHLLQAGESPQALFGSIAWFLRRFAAATRCVEQQERAGRRPDLKQALQQAGFRQWPTKATDRAAIQLRQISRRRGGQLYRWLLETDLALKGSHSGPHRARWALERLIFQLARVQTGK